MVEIENWFTCQINIKTNYNAFFQSVFFSSDSFHVHATTMSTESMHVNISLNGMKMADCWASTERIE